MIDDGEPLLCPFFIVYIAITKSIIKRISWKWFSVKSLSSVRKNLENRRKNWEKTENAAPQDLSADVGSSRVQADKFPRMGNLHACWKLSIVIIWRKESFQVWYFLLVMF